ncbi:hypothetical protein [Flavobacterium sp. ZS1P14]|uniref:hypothetical protein n=1 Tax=Flavobacterium sp. ZS1P14 TaxID=3401729 RepID=UPI003AAE8CB1
MHYLFFAIHSFVNRRKFLSVALFIGMLFLFLFFASKIKFSEDITKLIPTNNKSDVPAKVLNQLNFADKIAITIHLEKAGTTEDLSEYAQVFLDSVSNECKPYITSIQRKIDEENIKETMNFVHNNLPSFLNEKDYETIQGKLQKDRVTSAVAGNYKTITSPTGIVTKYFILQGPLEISFIGLKKLQQLNDFQLENGCMMTKDKNKLFLFITPNLPSSETKKNTFFAAKLNLIKDHLNQRFKTKAEVNYFGSTLIAVANTNQIKSVYYKIGLYFYQKKSYQLAQVQLGKALIKKITLPKKEEIQNI